MLERCQATHGVKNCIEEINKSSTMHELKPSEVTEKFNVGNKNGTFQNFIVFPEHIDYASCKCNNLQQPRSSPFKWKLFFLDTSHYGS